VSEWDYSKEEESYCLLESGFEELTVLEELTGGIGAATPAVDEPKPSCCSVFASTFPLGFSP